MPVLQDLVIPVEAVPTPPAPPVEEVALIPKRRLSEDLQYLLMKADGKSLTIGDLELAMGGRGFALAIIFLALPFTQPIPLPGVAVPFGIAIGLMGLRLTFGQTPWLPRFVRSQSVGFKTLVQILKYATKMAILVEKVIRPRMNFMAAPFMLNLVGLAIASAGFLLCLPFPIPFTNWVPAMSIILLALGLMERDGVFVLAGFVFGLAAWVYLSLVFLLGVTGVQKLFQYWIDLFPG